MDLFDSQASKFAPLAERMRPHTLEEFFGQEHLVGPEKVLRSLITQDVLSSLIFWGPPGVGKTTLAAIIAQTTGARFVSISAVNTSLKEAREILERARDDLKLHGKRTILFIDEIHRFNKAQQDAFLPAVEEGTVILIGATTENPSFEVNAALLSRSRVFILHALSSQYLENILNQALTDEKRGLGGRRLTIEPMARELLIAYANGDARSLLNGLELSSTLASEKGVLTKECVQEALQQKGLRYDKGGEEHYNVISAFIKSMRNSDPDATLYWLARMIAAGEDPVFIARRMMVFSAEDIGLADPQAIVISSAAAQAVHLIGFPEARITLATTAVYLARAAKNNTAYVGIQRALADVETHGNIPVPLHLRNAITNLMRDVGYGKGYQYAHEYENAETTMQCLPDELLGTHYLDR